MKKIIITTLLLILLIIGIMIISFSFYKDALFFSEKFLINNKQLIAERTAGKIKYLITDYWDSIDSLSEKIINKKVINNKINILLNNLLEEKIYIENICLYDKNNNPILFAPANFKPPNIKKSPTLLQYFKTVTLFGGEPILTKIFLNSEEKTSYAYIIVPVFIKPSQKLKYYLCATINFSKMNTLINPEVLNKYPGEAWITDSKGIIITSSSSNPLNAIGNKKTIPISLNIDPEPQTKLLNQKGNKIFQTSYAFSVFADRLILFIETPYDNVKHIISPFYIKLVLLMYLVILGAFLGGVIIIRDERIISKLRNRITKLEIYIDEEQKNKELKKITESTYFKELKEKANYLKNNTEQ